MGFRQTIGRLMIGTASASTQPGPADDFWYAPLSPGSNPAGVQVTAEMAMKASALFACIRFLATVIGSLPARVRKNTPRGAEDAPNHPLDELIRYQPNARQTAQEFWEQMVLVALLRGTSYAEIIPGKRGAVDQLEPIDWQQIRKVEMLPDRTMRLTFYDALLRRERALLQDELFRIVGMSANGVTGVPVVEAAADALGIGIAADQYAGRVFSNNLNVGGFIKHPGKMSADAQKNFLQALTERLAGMRNTHRPILLQEGMEFVKATFSAKDAQLLEARKWQIGEVARFFGIPLQYLGIYDGATHSNVEQQALDLIKYTLRPWVRRIEQSCRRDLIVAAGQYFVEFNLEGLLRGDSAARSQYFQAALGSGGTAPWMTQREVRRVEGLPDEPEPGDAYQTPSNQQPAPARQEAPGRLTKPKPPKSTPQDEEDDEEDGQDEEDARGIAARAEQLARVEVTAARRAAMRFADNEQAHLKWASSFYGGHVSKVMHVLEVERPAALAYCEFQRRNLEAAIVAGTDEQLVASWETSIPTEIARAFAQQETH